MFSLMKVDYSSKSIPQASGAVFRLLWCVWFLLIAIAYRPPSSLATTPFMSPVASTTSPCTPTPPDMLGPFYKPNAPERSSVGQGHVLRGVVRSAQDCAPIPNAKIEFWLAGPQGRYDDEHRATVFANSAGEYQFESSFPSPYAGRPSHIHLRVSADGYRTLVTQYYPEKGQSEGTFDLVLIPVGADTQRKA